MTSNKLAKAQYAIPVLLASAIVVLVAVYVLFRAETSTYTDQPTSYVSKKYVDHFHLPDEASEVRQWKRRSIGTEEEWIIFEIQSEVAVAKWIQSLGLHYKDIVGSITISTPHPVVVIRSTDGIKYSDVKKGNDIEFTIIYDRRLRKAVVYTMINTLW